MKNTAINQSIEFTLFSSLFLQTFQGERFLAAVAGRGRGAHEFHAAEPAHAERRQHVEVVQAHVLGREQCNDGPYGFTMHNKGAGRKWFASKA